MMPMHSIGTQLSQARNDRSSLELKAYLRDEWNASPEWLVRGSTRRNGSLWSRLRRWLLPRARAPEARQGEDSSEPVAVAPASDWLADVSVCPHLVTEDLGFGGSAQFLRCTLCGGVFVVHAGREWYLGPVASPEPEDSVAADLRLPLAEETVER